MYVDFKSQGNWSESEHSMPSHNLFPFWKTQKETMKHLTLKPLDSVIEEVFAPKKKNPIFFWRNRYNSID